MKLTAQITLFTALISAPGATFATEIPACALSGSPTVMIGGSPALRLSDVRNCPPELYEVISSISIDGEPVVHFKTGATEKMACAARGDQTVSLEGKQATRLGDVDCVNNK